MEAFITKVLGFAYFVGSSYIGYNFTRTKFINDFDEEVRNLREYDLSWEPINKDSILLT